MSLGESAGRVARHGLVMTNLMLLKESTGILYMEDLVPEVKEEEWFDKFLSYLLAYTADSSLSQEAREKARIYYDYAQTLDNS